MPLITSQVYPFASGVMAGVKGYMSPEHRDVARLRDVNVLPIVAPRSHAIGILRCEVAPFLKAPCGEKSAPVFVGDFFRLSCRAYRKCVDIFHDPRVWTRFHPGLDPDLMFGPFKWDVRDL